MGVAQTLTVIAFGLVAPSGAVLPAGDGAALQAVAASCSGAATVTGKAPARIETMSCGVNVVRRSFGLGALRESARLNRSSLLKANAVRRCGFSHTPCGMAFTRTFTRAGYMPARSIAENLAWGEGERGSTLQTLGSWLASPSHRANLLARRWQDLGVAVERGTMFGHTDVSLWVLQFGRHR
jgi:uncharacterized protein YkwD